MMIVVQHQITNAPHFWRIAEGAAFRIPPDVQLYSLLPSRDATQAVSLWEARRIEQVQRFLASEVGRVATATFFEVDPRFALLPSTMAYAPGSRTPACLRQRPAKTTRTGGASAEG
ncbi:MAG: hypothetical protein GVY18_07895 [Bacteroidetes bacterium]|jgi:hypothetical protein|nr:hypothetical protein [Bacteroidota bacterium]